MPFGMARRHIFVGKVCVLMTIPALECVKAFAVGTALHVLEMRVAVLALQRNVPAGWQFMQRGCMKTGYAAM